MRKLGWNKPEIKAWIKAKEKVMPKRPDWKGLSALIGAGLAVAGFVWNKAEGCMDRAVNQQVQAASYEALASKVDALYGRLDRLEGAVLQLPTLFTKRKADARRLVAPVKTVDEPVLAPPDLAMSRTDQPVLTPPEKLFERSGLPTFQQLQKIE
jgi:hypothetical protein